ncbi:MAG: hypothetical protein HYZ93_05005 [Candidatus Omnitrophica bacterium]|nr:hypothetical protein [Candidatus Omnitrophota bacterium]
MGRNWLYVVPLTAVSLIVGFVQARQVVHPRPVASARGSLTTAPGPVQVQEVPVPPAVAPAAPVRRFRFDERGAGKRRDLETRDLALRHQMLARSFRAALNERRVLKGRLSDLDDTVEQLERRVLSLGDFLEAASRPQPQPAPVKADRARRFRALSEAWEDLGFEYLRLGSGSEAARAFDRALSWNPADPALHYNRGILAEDYLHQPQAALRHYRIFLSLAPEDPAAADVREWVKGLEAE